MTLMLYVEMFGLLLKLVLSVVDRMAEGSGIDGGTMATNASFFHLFDNIWRFNTFRWHLEKY
jgi:hypothetical protein